MKPNFLFQWILDPISFTAKETDALVQTTLLKNVSETMPGKNSNFMQITHAYISYSFCVSRQTGPYQWRLEQLCSIPLHQTFKIKFSGTKNLQDFLSSLGLPFLMQAQTDHSPNDQIGGCFRSSDLPNAVREITSPAKLSTYGHTSTSVEPVAAILNMKMMGLKDTSYSNLEILKMKSWIDYFAMFDPFVTLGNQKSANEAISKWLGMWLWKIVGFR
ncbi:hypothetical protein Ccrd_016297 [Cynara cardunculus var. scolymus]|uniref:Uncharacterized protein n=1 Tax=Cynara cardunculus var. scolymus TaxID=59895 RepID=A0A118K344_CYNCS|nr:hypothetical protein Ccrd_016297 [Cynara cardunculus var. scolymus]